MKSPQLDYHSLTAEEARMAEHLGIDDSQYEGPTSEQIPAYSYTDPVVKPLGEELVDGEGSFHDQLFPEECDEWTSLVNAVLNEGDLVDEDLADLEPIREKINLTEEEQELVTDYWRKWRPMLELNAKNIAHVLQTCVTVKDEAKLRSGLLKMKMIFEIMPELAAAYDFSRRSTPAPEVRYVNTKPTPERREGENLDTVVIPETVDRDKYVAQEIADVIRSKEKEGDFAVLGLATGSTPVGVYKELVRMHKEEGLSFRNVITYNLDEYWPMDPEHEQSYRTFMDQNLFDHVDIDPENTHVPGLDFYKKHVNPHFKGRAKDLDEEQVAKLCERYEKRLRTVGIDIQLLGIGVDGHIGFNEANKSPYESKTREVELALSTRRRAQDDFDGNLRNVPKKAITMGINSILHADKIILMATGDAKADIIQQTIEGSVDQSNPSSFLQPVNDKTTIVLDEAAAKNLQRMQ